MTLTCLFVPAFPAWACGRGARGGRPLVVVGSRRVVACSPRAARAGVMVGMPVERARALLPEVMVCRQDVHFERAVWEDVLHRLNRLSPFLESPAPGTAFLQADDPAALRALVQDFGMQAGVAAARPLAHLAALRAAPGRVLTVAPGQADPFLERFPVAGLAGLGFSRDFTERLVLFGYDTLGKARALSRRQLRAQFGPEGAALFDVLHADDDRPVPLFQPPPTVACAYDFDVPVIEPGDVLPVLAVLVRRAAGRLGALQCRRVRLMLRLQGPSEPVVACRVLSASTSEPRRLHQTAKALLPDLLGPGREVTSVTLELGALHAAAYRQAGLFRERPSVYDVARLVHHRFPGALLRAVVCPHALFQEEGYTLEPFPLEPPPKPRRRSRAGGRA